MDVALENPGKRVPKVQGRLLLNLSGKRTEWVNANLTSSRPFSRRSILLAAFFICQNEIKEVKQKWKQF